MNIESSLARVVGGLRITPSDWRAAVVSTIGCAATVSAIVIVVDCAIFRSILPANYLLFFGGPDLLDRIVLFMTRAIVEEVQFRLLLMSALVAIGGVLWRDREGAIRPEVFVIAILVAQVANVLPKLAPPTTAAEVAYDVVRYYLPGLFWGWLYWRRGWIAAAVAHAGAHPIIQPALLVMLGR